MVESSGRPSTLPIKVPITSRAQSDKLHHDQFSGTMKQSVEIKCQTTAELLAEAMRTIKNAITLSDATECDLRTQVRTLTSELENAKKEKDAAIQEAATLRAKQAAHEEEVNLAKTNHVNHVKKIKANLAKEHEEKIQKLKQEVEKEKEMYQKKADEPTKLRQESQKAIVENKGLKKNLAKEKEASEVWKEKASTSAKEIDMLRKEREKLMEATADDKKTLERTSTLR